ncbi:MAG: hypothetical protein MI739_12845 [Bacteroidales bacterium]|nr:hypothetical protein [Bacteroidales bacterium]
MKIIVIHSNKEFKKEVTVFLEKVLFHKVIAFVSDDSEFLKLKNIVEADVILIDVSTSAIDAFVLVKRVLINYHYLKFVALTDDLEKICLLDLLQSGFKGCILKRDFKENITSVLNAICLGKSLFPREIKIKAQDNKSCV